MFRFSGNYFILAILLLLAEILIAFFAHDPFIRPYGGDFLVVILLYCLSRSFLNIPVLTTAMLVLAFSYTIEVAQYFQLINSLGLENHHMLQIIVGHSFEWMDLLAYTLGIFTILIIEKRTPRR